MINNGSNLLVDGYCWKRVGCETNLSRRVLERPSRFCESPAIARRPCVCARVYGLLTQRLGTRRSPALIGTTRRECYSARRASFAHTRAHICTCAHTHMFARATMRVSFRASALRYTSIVRRGRPLSMTFSHMPRERHTRAPYTPQSRSGMNETMISTHGAKVGDSSGARKRVASDSLEVRSERHLLAWLVRLVEDSLRTRALTFRYSIITFWDILHGSASINEWRFNFQSIFRTF